MLYPIVLWMVLSLVLSSWALDKKIGFRNAFLLSLFLSPVVGLIVILISKNHEEAVPIAPPADEDEVPEHEEMEIIRQVK